MLWIARLLQHLFVETQNNVVKKFIPRGYFRRGVIPILLSLQIS